MGGGNFTEAAILFHQSAIESPHFKTYELLGECYLQMKRVSEAIPFLAAATTLNQGVRAPALLADAWLCLGAPDKAADAANIALARDPKNKIALRIKDIVLRQSTDK